MNNDIQLCIRIRSRWYGKRNRTIAIVAPAAYVQTTPGKLTDPPKNLWGATSGYASGDINVKQLGDWLSNCIGQPILDVVRQLYPATNRDHMNVLVTAEDQLRSDLMRNPWELMESLDSSQGLPLAEHLTVTRILNSKISNPTTPVGERLKIALLWANPRKDIPGLQEHLAQLKQFVSEHSSDFSMVGPFEFTGLDEILKNVADERVHIVYHIGHAIQPPDQTVQLLVGTEDNPFTVDVDQFRALLQQIGPPRLLLLSACAAAVGYQLNPYLGAALRMVQQIEAVIAMQTMVPVRAAIQFAGEFFRGLAAGDGLGSSVKRGRIQILRLERPVRGRQSFIPYIPVLFQRTVQDKLFAIDVTGRHLRETLFALKSQIERIDPYLDRVHDPALLKIFQTPLPNRRVGFVFGPKGSGKSSSIRRVIFSLTTEQQFRAGHRWLYYDVPKAKLTAGTSDNHVRNLLVAFANAMGITESLKQRLSSSDNPGDAIPILVNWLYEQERDGRKTCICLDNIDVELADVVARQSANLLTDGGSLVLIAEKHSLGPDTPVNLVSIAPMTPDEIAESLQKHAMPWDNTAVQAALKFSNGLPYFVAGYILCPHPSDNVKELAANLIERYRPGPSDQQRRILQFTALCSVPVPAQLLENLYPAEAIRELLADYPFLRQTESNMYLVPDALREYLSDALENRLELHRNAFNEFRALAAAQESSSEQAIFQQVSAWYREAFEHGCSIAEDPAASQAILDETREIAETLHDRYFLGHETEASLSLWERFRNIEHSLDIYDDRSADAHYAECLMRVARFDEADELLEQVAVGEYVDRIQLSALFLRSNLVKNTGRKNEFCLRLDLLRQALEIGRQLEEQSEQKDWARKQVAVLEHSLGNALGYGKDAEPARALEHLSRAQKIFEEMGDFGYAYFRTISEQIEVKRYNRQLSPGERQEAIKTLTENLRNLVARDMKYDAIMHCYELGRLSEDPAESAKWFGEAFRRAEDNFEPVNWHAAVHWCMARVKAKLEAFGAVAPELQRYADKLLQWQTWAWSRRIRRDALQFLAKCYDHLGRAEEALAAAKSAWEMVLSIHKLGEGRKDAAKRLPIACLYGRLSVLANHLEQARSVAITVAPELEMSPDSVAALNPIELGELFRAKSRNDNYE
jgi:hypothetical protein